MRPGTIIDRLPEFTPALLEIAAHTFPPGSQIPDVATQPQWPPAADTRQNNIIALGSLGKTLQATIKATPTGPEGAIARMAGSSLGALAHITGYAARLEGYEKIETGVAVKKMARTAIRNATREFPYFERDAHNPHRFHRNRRLGKDDAHVLRHADSYRTLLPLMRWPTRFYVSRVLHKNT